jgi:DNA-binding IclR family transcriptional regulator
MTAVIFDPLLYTDAPRAPVLFRLIDYKFLYAEIMTKNTVGASEPKRNPGKQQGIQSIEIGGSILRALITIGRPAMLKDIALMSGMPAAKAHRYLVSFQRMGIVNQDLLSARYHLGPFALTIGLSALASLDPIRLASPILDELCDEIGMGVGLAVWGSSGATIVRYVDTGDAISVCLRVGRVLGLHDSATGRCFNAFYNPSAIQPALSAELEKLAGKDKALLSSLEREQKSIINTTRDDGIARASGSHTPGINGLSAPVFDHTGQMVAAITAVGTAGQFEAGAKSTEAAKVLAASTKLSSLLGYGSSEPS